MNITMRVVLLLFCTGFLQQICDGLSPVPHSPQGFIYKDIDHPVVEIDLFLDLTCPDSKAAFPIVKQVVDQFENQVLLRAYMFPLPYHRSSYLACRGTFAIDSFNSNLTYTWMETIFQHQSIVSNAATSNLGDDKVEEILGRLAVNIGMKANDFIEKSSSNSYTSIVQWKYGCTRGVYGTPIAFVNGVNINLERKWTIDDWVKLIGHLV